MYLNYLLEWYHVSRLVSIEWYGSETYVSIAITIPLCTQFVFGARHVI